nr:retrovirus-related Pol polyprotein from transposon TNT 1-94 [Tanacetum cinerariifolium]
MREFLFKTIHKLNKRFSIENRRRQPVNKVSGFVAKSNNGNKKGDNKKFGNIVNGGNNRGPNLNLICTNYRKVGHTIDRCFNIIGYPPRALLENGFVQSKFDYSLFTKKFNKVFIALLVYVDDIMIISNDLAEIKKFKMFLKSKFQIKDLGKLKYFLGIEVLDNDDGTPLPENTTLKHVKNEDDLLLDSIFMHDPLVSHLDVALRVLRYLKGSLGSGIQINKSDNLKLRDYVDSDRARYHQLRLNREAWLLPLIAANPIFHEKSKNFEIDVHLVREKVAGGVIKTKKIHTTQQIANVLTKALDIEQRKVLCEKLGLLNMFKRAFAYLLFVQGSKVSSADSLDGNEEPSQGSSNSSAVIVQNVQDAPFPTGVILDDTNYPLWSQLMEMHIGARNKFGFITGKSPKPITNEKQIETWLIDNNRVKSWLIDSMNPTLIRCFIRLQTAAEIWEAVRKTFYDGSDETQLFELNRRSFTTRQNGRSLPTYYNELVSIFQEIDTRLTTGEDTLEQTVILNKTLSRFCVHIFLAGLDLDFNQARSEILRKDPPLDLDSYYAYIRKDHNQRLTVEEPKLEPDSMVYMATQNQPQNSKARMEKEIHSHAHTMEKRDTRSLGAMKLLGIQAGGILQKKPRKKIGQATMATSSQTKAVNTSMATHTSVNFGTLNPNNDWIIDTGATDHMTNDPMKLTTSHTPKQISIQTANGEVAPVTSEGSVKVMNFMDLDSVLVVPSLSANLLSCGICELVKNKRISYVPSNNKTSVPFMKIHSDVWRPAPIPTLNEARYFVTFIDECAQMVWISLLKNKGEVHNAFKELHHIIKTVYISEIQILQSDNDGEYINDKMQLFCKEHSIHHQTSCARTPQQNGLAERRNRQILEIVQASLFDMNVPRRYWGEADTDDEDEEINEHNKPRYPVRTNRGVLKKRYQADLKAKSKYPISNYVSDHRLAHSHALRVEKLSTEEVYIDPPTGLKNSGKVCKLKRGLYGLKQSPRTWFGRFSSFMKRVGYKQNDADHTLFVKNNRGKVTALIVYVDDMVVTGNDREEIVKLQTILAAEFELKDLGQLKYFLGIEVARSKAGITMCQRKYMLDLLAETGMLDCKPVDTPIETNHKLSIHQNQVPANRERVYFLEDKEYEVSGYTYADWAGDRMDGKSTSGYFTFVEGNLVTWRSKKQKVVSRSSAEAEFRGMVHGICELLWIRRILRDLGIELTKPVKLYCDNESAVKIANNPIQHDRTKNVEIDRHFIKDHLEKRTVELPHVASVE